MKINIALIVILAIQIQCFSQAPGFNKRFTYPYFQNRIFKILIENDAIVALGDGNETDSTLNKGLILMKLDTFGNLINSNFIYDSILSTNPVPLRWGSFRATADGGYFMNATPILSAYPLLLKTDNDFNLEYIKIFPDSSGHDYQLTDFISIPDGYLLFGAYRRWNNTINGYIHKMDLAGNLIWLKNYGSIGNSQSINDVEMINDTTFAVSMVHRISSNSSFSSIKIINQYGEELQTWSSQPEPEIGYLRDILSADEDGYLVYGLYPLEFLPPFDMLVQSTLSRLDKDFNLLWSKRYGKEVTLSSEIMFYNFERTTDSSFIAVGTTSIDQPTTSPLSCGWLMKFSPEGDSIWSRLDLSDIQPVSYTNTHRFGGVGVLSSGSIVAGGYARHLNDNYAWLVKVTNDGCLDTLYCGLVSGSEGVPAQEAHRLAVYPNPVGGDVVTVDAAGDPVSPFRASIHDAAGKLVGAYSTVGGAALSLPVGTLPNGLYFLTLKFPDGRLHQEKIIVQH